jgi:ditrans,polycis-polyprenyl diphosphate synthase
MPALTHSYSHSHSHTQTLSHTNSLALSSQHRSFLLRLIRAGPIPRHVAFIMDGNRRFAKKIHVQTQRGHLLGFEKLQETLHWCLDLGVETVTVYAFSIENFKRSKDEVDALMTLATQKFKKLMEKSDLIQQQGVRVRVLGEVTMLPLELQQIIAKAVHMSRHNTRAVLNVCFAYTSRQEIVNAANRIAIGIDKGELLPRFVCVCVCVCVCAFAFM